LWHTGLVRPEDRATRGRDPSAEADAKTDGPFLAGRPFLTHWLFIHPDWPESDKSRGRRAAP
jgi:hypothetical protein